MARERVPQDVRVDVPKAGRLCGLAERPVDGPQRADTTLGPREDELIVGPASLLLERLDGIIWVYPSEARARAGRGEWIAMASVIESENDELPDELSPSFRLPADGAKAPDPGQEALYDAFLSSSDQPEEKRLRHVAKAYGIKPREADGIIQYVQLYRMGLSPGDPTDLPSLRSSGSDSPDTVTAVECVAAIEGVAARLPDEYDEKTVSTVRDRCNKDASTLRTHDVALIRCLSQATAVQENTSCWETFREGERAAKPSSHSTSAPAPDHEPPDPKELYDELKELHTFGSNLSALRARLLGDGDLAASQACGTAMRTALPRAKAARAQADKLPATTYLDLRVAAMEIRSCVTCAGDADDYCKRAKSALRRAKKEL